MPINIITSPTADTDTAFLGQLLSLLQLFGYCDWRPEGPFFFWFVVARFTAISSAFLRRASESFAIERTSDPINNGDFTMPGATPHRATHTRAVPG